MAPRSRFTPAPPPAPVTPVEPVDLSTVPLRVRATQLGFYGNQRRRVGDVFDLVKPEDFAAVWMTDAAVVPPPDKKPGDVLPWLRKEHASLMAGDTPTLQKNAADLEPEDETPTGDQTVI